MEGVGYELMIAFYLFSKLKLTFTGLPGRRKADCYGCTEVYVTITFPLSLQRRGENTYASAKIMNSAITGLLLMSCLMGPSSTFRIAMGTINLPCCNSSTNLTMIFIATATLSLAACFLSQHRYHPAPNSGAGVPYIGNTLRPWAVFLQTNDQLVFLVYNFVQLFVVSFAVISTEVLCHHFHFKFGSPPDLVSVFFYKTFFLNSTMKFERNLFAN